MSRATDVKLTVYGTKLAETEKAVKFIVRAIGESPVEVGKPEWFPFSQIARMVTNPNEAGRDYLIVSEWIMKEKGLIDRIVKTDPRHAPPDVDSDDDWEEEDPGIF